MHDFKNGVRLFFLRLLERKSVVETCFIVNQCAASNPFIRQHQHSGQVSMNNFGEPGKLTKVKEKTC